MASFWRWQPVGRFMIDNYPDSRRQSSSPNGNSSFKSPKSVLDMLKNREIGFGANVFQQQAVEYKSKTMHCIEKMEQPRCGVNKDIAFLKGGKTTIFSSWADKGNTILTQTKHYFSNWFTFIEGGFFYYEFGNAYKVVDLKEYYNHAQYLLLVLSNETESKEVLLFKPPFRSISLPKMTCVQKDKIFCCDANSFSKRMTFGEERRIGLIFDGNIRAEVPTRSEVHSITFDNLGNIIYFGDRLGNLGLLDLRVEHFYYNQLCTEGVNEMVLLSDENQLVCGGFDGLLVNFDMRMKRAVYQYFGHVRGGEQKIPISIDEPNSLLCATGTDNITRLWDLKGGHPLKSIHPPIESVPCRSYLASNGYKYYLTLLQKGHVYFYNNL